MDQVPLEFDGSGQDLAMQVLAFTMEPTLGQLAVSLLSAWNAAGKGPHYLYQPGAIY